VLARSYSRQSGRAADGKLYNVPDASGNMVEHHFGCYALFMNLAEGSLEECRYYVILAHDLGYGDTSGLRTPTEEVSKLLCAYASTTLSSV